VVEVNGGDVYPGRTFTRLEDLASSPVAVINRKLEDQLFRGRDPIDQTIHIAGVPFTVIGVYMPLKYGTYLTTHPCGIHA